MITIKPPKGTLTHAVTGDPLAITATSYMAVTLCGKEFKGRIGTEDGAEVITCKSCNKAIASDQPPAPEPVPVFDSPEAIDAPEQAPDLTGRRRHGMVTYQRAMARHHMKRRVAELAKMG